MTRRPLLIAGPTASGKSALALRIARRDGGCVINADASQVYRCWRILTARPDAADERAAPHLLFGHVDCARRYSAGAWLEDLRSALAEIQARNLRPIVTGGTGLYFAALTEGLAAIPPIPPGIRARSEALMRSEGIERLRADLAQEDLSTLAAIDPDNPMRVQRAWTVLMATGRGLADWHRETAAPLLAEHDCDTVVLAPEKPFLHKRITTRIEQMLEDDALDECRRNAGLRHTRLPSARVLGANRFWACLAGETTLPAAIEATAADTRRLAKRQMTWFRGRMGDWRWLDPAAGDPARAIKAG